LLACVAAVGSAARAEVDVVSWGQQTYDQGDVRERYSQIAAGGHHTVALKNDGTVVAWGNNNSGQWTVPSGLSGVTQIAAGHRHTVALVTFTDCNTNGQRDTYEIGKGWVTDLDADTRPDTCQHAAGDLDLSGFVDAADIGAVLLVFGDCPQPAAGCFGDMDGSGSVDAADIGMLLLAFGPIG
jgi:hypothetical protein